MRQDITAGHESQIDVHQNICSQTLIYLYAMYEMTDRLDRYESNHEMQVSQM